MANVPTLSAIQDWLVAAIQPYVILHGGHVRIVAYNPDRRILELELSGACSTCPFVMMTIQHGVKQRFKDTFGDSYDPVDIKVKVV
jgi:Fe-S cluster biogenesis protein NfuA